MSLLAKMSSPLARRQIAFVCVAMMVAGCAGQAGTPIASLQATSGPRAGMARVVVMRSEKGFYGWGDQGLPVSVDEQSIGEMTTGNYVSSDIAPGRHQVSLNLWDQPGVSRYELNAAPGRTYFLMAKVKEKVNQVHMAGTVFGPVGYGLAAAASDDGTGPIEITPLSEAEGRRVIAASRQQ
jgi:hypothetical protein